MRDLTRENDPRTRIPAIHRLAKKAQQMAPGLPHDLAVGLARKAASCLQADVELNVDQALLAQLQPLLHPGPQPVINGTGILLHTNLGRAPLDPGLIAKAVDQVKGYTDLELDLATGKRGHRDRHFARLAASIWDVEDATLVNNAAAGVALALAALAGQGETIVSRGELIEIGGSYRLPDVMVLAGTQLREVGTTNKTRIEDYQNAIGPQTHCLLKTHTSNYRIEGFTAEVSLARLCALGRAREIPVVMDLGSGLSASLPFPETAEPAVEEYLSAQPDLLIFSGDKLFGGIQAGIVLGKRAAVQRMRKHPLMRMVRQDKLSIAVTCSLLQRTALSQAHPLANLANTTVDQLRKRAIQIIASLAHIPVDSIEDEGFTGGGSLPQEKRPSISLVLTTPQPSSLAKRLREGEPAVLGYVRQQKVFINLSTVFPEQDQALITALKHAFSGIS